MTKESTTPRAESEPTALNRRQFLGGVSGTAAALAVGAVGLEPTVDLSAAAEANEIGPTSGQQRLNNCVKIRRKSAESMLKYGIPKQKANGDEDLYPNRIGNYSKGLPHDAFGEVDPAAYDAFLYALSTGAVDDFNGVPLGGNRKLVDPLAGLDFDTEGLDSHQFALAPAPAFASAEQAAEFTELYWMALLRDVRYDDYASDAGVAQAAAELSGLPAFTGPRIGGQVTPQTLFRDQIPGCLDGPYLSQFFFLPTPFGAETVDRRSRVFNPGTDHGTTFNAHLALQNGFVPTSASYDPTRRYLRNGRDLASWVHVDVLFQAYFNACLALGALGAPIQTNPYGPASTLAGFVTWGGAGLKGLLCEVATRALKAVWFQKWYVHRRLRPEAFAGRIHVHKQGWRNYPIHPSVLSSQAVAATESLYGSSLLPQAYPEGSPTHPSFGAGHNTVAGACVTVLKAFFDESFPIPHTLVPDGSGTGLVDLGNTGLTVGGELNKVASNVAQGRNFASVHWRSEGLSSLILGEQVAINVLKDNKATYAQNGSFVFTDFLGNTVEI
jgi:hypothetical protein